MRVPHMARSTMVDDDRAGGKAIDDWLLSTFAQDWVSPWLQQHGPSATRGPAGQLQTRTKQRLRIPRIANALVRLNPGLARSATKRSRWLPFGPRGPSTSSGEGTAPPPNPE